LLQIFFGLLYVVHFSLYTPCIFFTESFILFEIEGNAFDLSGIIQSVRAVADRRLQHERRSRVAVEQELAKFRVYCLAQDREIATLRGILRKHGLTVDDDGVAARAAIAAATISVVAEVNSSADMAAVDQLPPDHPIADTLA